MVSTLRELELAQVAPRVLELLRKRGVDRLTEFQLESVNNGIMRDANQILATYDYDEAYQIAEIAILNRVASDYRARALVLCPNPHQAEMKYNSIGHKCRRLGIESAVIIRRRDAIQEEWQSGRVVVSTYRAMDIALRTAPDALDNVVAVLIDRLDLIGQPGLGATLETVLVALTGIGKRIQYIAISPPVADIEELANWLDASQVIDQKAEVKLIFSVKSFDSVNESLADLTEFVHYRRGQVMILCANAPTSEDLATRLSGKSGDDGVALDLRLTPEYRDDLRELSLSVMESYRKCEMTTKLGSTLSQGVAFFHEGVSRAQRRMISEAWEDGLLPVIVMPMRFAIASGLKATVVFLMGVFMQELGKDLTHEDSVTMLSEWQLNDVLQSAGRRGIDNDAFGIVVVDNEEEKTRILAKYFVADSEGNISPREGEVDSVMDDTENIQDLVLGQICGVSEESVDPFSIINRTFWATSNRMTGPIRDGTLTSDGTTVDQLVSLRTTKSTEKRAEEIPDESVKVVSLNPSKIEGLVRSGSREMWHYVSLKATDGVSCSCESWKYQGIRKHRLCKHLVKFAKHALKAEETKQYASSVIEQSLRGLEVIGELERAGLVQRVRKTIRCTELGENATYLGVPVPDAKRVMKAISERKGNLKDIVLGVATARSNLPRTVVSRIIDALPADNIEDLVCGKNEMPGIVENCIEEIDYINMILLRLMGEKRTDKLKKDSIAMEDNLRTLIGAIR
jgi:replicative superfamily II helicase